MASSTIWGRYVVYRGWWYPPRRKAHDMKGILRIDMTILMRWEILVFPRPKLDPWAAEVGKRLLGLWGGLLEINLGTFNDFIYTFSVAFLVFCKFLFWWFGSYFSFGKRHHECVLQLLTFFGVVPIGPNFGQLELGLVVGLRSLSVYQSVPDIPQSVRKNVAEVLDKCPPILPLAS
ncbi:hypothetical protein DY000_02033951 [Brassica cretica]|uniref:Uncharacterized protein n=1 Tax=Brassica cretica TaxID=69181 RepID=A0ABQ7DFP8_BRACR|nr:hypothetical protein DY000_02033951 [Brassica cretica]